MTFALLLAALIANGTWNVAKLEGLPILTEIEQYQTNINNNGGSIAASDLAAVSNFVVSAKANGYWTNLIDCSPLAGNNTNAAVVKLIRGGTSPWLLTNNGFSAAMYSATTAFSGDGSAWLDTGFSYNQLPFTNRHGASVWLMDPMTNTTVGGEAAIGIDLSAQPYFGLLSNYGIGYEDTAGYSIFGGLAQRGTRWGQGLLGVTRNSLTTMTLYQNDRGIIQETNVAPQAMPRATTISLFGLRSFSGVSFPLKHGIGWYAVDNGIATNQLPAYYSDVRRLMNSLGRITTPNYPQRTFLVVGQSLAVGTGSGLPQTTSNAGPTRALSPGSGFPVVTLGTRYRGGRSYFAEVNNETGWRAFSDHFIALCRTNGHGETNNPLILNWAYGGAAYTVLRKGSPQLYDEYGISTNWYTHSIYDVTNALGVQTNLIGNGLLVPAVFSVHGESDTYVAGYADYMDEWQTNYQADIKAVTGQTNRVVMFHSQTGNSTYPATGVDPPRSNLGMLAIHETNSNHVVVCPKYQLIHGSDGVHLTNQTYRVLGEYYAEAAFKELILGRRWEPVRPVDVVRTNAAIWITYTGIVASLFLDTNLVYYATNYGFAYSNTPTANIASVSLVSTNKVVVTLDSTPSGPGLIRYAMNATNSVVSGGPLEGARGNLRDQNTQVGITSTSNLYNWSVVFDKAVP